MCGIGIFKNLPFKVADDYAKKKFRCLALMGISSFSITFKISSHTLRFSLIAWLRKRYAG